MSPAHTHVEQTRNTLLFASCAKEVVTNARVNLVMSDKALIKHLQRELTKFVLFLFQTRIIFRLSEVLCFDRLTKCFFFLWVDRLESELRFTGSGSVDCTSHAEALKEKDAKIRKVCYIFSGHQDL